MGDIHEYANETIISIARCDSDDSPGNYCCHRICKRTRNLSLQREHENTAQSLSDYQPVCGYKDRRIFYVRVDNRGDADEWVGMSITYYRQTTSGPGYQMIGSDSLQSAVEGTRTLDPSEIQHAGGYDWIHTHPGQSYYMYGGRVPDDARWVVYCMPWYYDNGNHGWMGFNGPGGDSDRCHVCVVY